MGKASRSSSLGIVLKALDRDVSTARDIGAAHSFLMRPLWAIEEDSQSHSEAAAPSLRKVSVASDNLDFKVRKQNELLAAIRDLPATAKPQVVELLRTNLKGIKSESGCENGNSLRFSSLVSERVVEDQELRKLLYLKSRGLSRKLVIGISKWCVKAEFWDPVATLVACGLISSNEFPQLVDRIVDDGNIALVLLCVLHVADIRPSQWLEILKLFLDGSKKTLSRSLLLQRKLWRQLIVNHIEEAVKTRENISRDGDEMAAKVATCVNLAVAFDKFTASELCLHLVLSADHDEAVLGAIVLELESSEVVVLFRYLNKWLEAYCAKLMHVRKMKVADEKLVPSLQTIIRWLSTILDCRYASLVMAHELRQELNVTTGLVSSLVTVGGKMRNLEGVLQDLLSQAALPGEKLGVQSAEHIIEYLEIS